MVKPRYIARRMVFQAIRSGGSPGRVSLRFLATIAVTALGPVEAQVYWDNGNGNSQWATATNWATDAVPGTTAAVIFDDTYVAVNQTLNLGSATRQIGSATFAGALDYTFNNTSANRYFQINSSGLNFAQNGSGNVVINAPVYIASNLGFTGAGTGTVTINGKITDGGGTDLLQKNGSFMLILNGSNAHDGTVMNAGTLVFGSDTAAGSSTMTLNGGTIQAGTAARTLANSVALGGDFTVGGTLDLTLSGAMNLGGASRTITVANAGTTTLSGVISNGTLIKDGGTLTIAGGSANTLAGGITVVDGSLIFNKTGGRSASGTGNLTIGDSIGAAHSAILQLAAADQITDTVAVTVNADGRFDLNNNSDTVGSISGIGNIVLGSGTLTVGGSNSSTWSGDISGAGNLAKASTGTLTLDTANSYSGNTTISGGAINVRHADALGTSATGTTVASGGTLQLEGGVNMATETLSLSGSGASTTGALRSIAGNNTYSAAISLAAAARINSDADTLTISGTVTAANFALTVGGAGDTSVTGNLALGSGGLIKDGSGTLTVFGTSTYTGTTTVSAGRLNVQSNGGLGGGTAVTSVTSGGTLALQGGVTVNKGSLTLNGSGVGGAGALQNVSGYNNWANNITLGSPSTITSAANSTLVLGKTDYSSTLGLGANTLTLDGPGNIYINATVTGTGNSEFVKEGVGTATFFGNSNTYTGLTSVNDGTLVLDTDNSVANYNTTIRGDLVIGDGSGSAESAVVRHAVAFLSHNKISDTAQVTINSDGHLDLNNNDDRIGALVFSGGHVTTGSGVLTLNGNVTTNVSNQSATMDGVVNLGSVTRTFTVADGGAYSDLLVNSTLDFGGISKTGTGRMTLTGASAYAGTTAVTAGSLNIQNSAALGTISGGTSVSNGAALELEHAIGINVGSESLTLNGAGISNGGAMRNVAGNNSWAGAITLSTASRINSDAGTLAIAGGIASANRDFTVGGSGDVNLSGAIGLGTGSVTKDGAGTLTMSGSAANSFSGGLFVNGGTVALNRTAGINNASGAGNVTIGDAIGASNSAILRLNQGDQISNSSVVTINADGMFDLNGMSETIGNLTGSGTLAIGTGTLIAGNATASSTFSGGITGSGVLTKQGTGTLIISSNPGTTFAGAVNVTAGTLEFNGTFPSTLADLTLSGGTLRLTGSTLNVGTLHITGNTVIDFGNASASILNAETFTIDSGVSLSIVGWTSTVDHFTAVTWTGATLNTKGTGPQTQVNFSGFNSIDTGWSGSTYPGFNEITPVPEPGTYGVVLIGCATAFAVWRRRNRRNA